MADLDRYLLRSEQKVFAVRRHWAALASSAGWLTLFLIGGLIGVALFSQVYLLRLTCAIFLVFSLFWFAWIVLDWYFELFVVTNRRVLLVNGILTRRVAIMPLLKVTDLTYEQSLAGRAMDYGAFVIESAGQHQALSRIDFLPQPNLHYHQVSRLLFGTAADVDPDDLPDTHPTAPVPRVPPDARR